MLHMTRALLVLVLAGGGSAILAGGAAASTALGVTGGSRVDFRAAAGEANRVNVDRDVADPEAPDSVATRFVIQDFGSQIDPRAECLPSDRLPKFEVTCPINPAIWVMLGDERDIATGHTTDVKIRLEGGPGDDLLETGWANDELFGGTGEDDMIGDFGDDIMDGGDDRDSVNGEAGDNQLRGGDGPDIVYDGSGNSTIYGDTPSSADRGKDRLYDSGGSDYFLGGPGNDRIEAADPKLCETGPLPSCVNGAADRRIDCGSGRRDRVSLDPHDSDGAVGDDRGRVRNCERVFLPDY